jgi:AbrB family looped-hinge helix DNA binding protein
MTYKVGPKGQVVLPKAIRDEFGIEPGDDVEVLAGQHEIVIRKAIPHQPLRGLLAGLPGAGTKELEAARRIERGLEDEKLKRLP